MSHRHDGGRIGSALREPLGSIVRAPNELMRPAAEQAIAPLYVAQGVPELDREMGHPARWLQLDLAEQRSDIRVARRRDAPSGGDGTGEIAGGNDVRAGGDADQLGWRDIVIENPGGVVGTLEVTHAGAAHPASVVDVGGASVSNE